jgi:hypothetical protein
VILVLDDHISKLKPASSFFFKLNSTVFLSIPAHGSYMTQLLVCGSSGSLKPTYRQESDVCIVNHIHQPITTKVAGLLKRFLSAGALIKRRKPTRSSSLMYFDPKTSALYKFRSYQTQQQTVQLQSYKGRCIAKAVSSNQRCSLWISLSVLPQRNEHQVTGSSPAEDMDFKGHKTPQHTFLRMGSKAGGTVS